MNAYAERNGLFPSHTPPLSIPYTETLVYKHLCTRESLMMWFSDVGCDLLKTSPVNTLQLQQSVFYGGAISQKRKKENEKTVDRALAT